MKRWVNQFVNWSILFAGRNGWLNLNQMLYTAMVAHGANLRGITRQLKKQREPMAVQVDMVLACGLCPTCKTRANAAIYTVSELDKRIDTEWERWEAARARQERLIAGETEDELRKWGLLQ